MRFLLPIILALLLISCANNTGNNFNHANTQQLRQGMTEQEVIQILKGKPNSYKYELDGSYTAHWIYTRSAGFPIVTVVEGKLLYILFDKNHRMIEILQYSYNTY